MTIKFNFDMATNYNYSLLLNSTLIDMYIIPEDNRHIDDPAFNLTKLNFTWEVVNFEDDELQVQMNFECAVCLSPGLQQDRILIDLRNATQEGFFFSPVNEFKGLHEIYQILISDVRKQMVQDDFSATFASTAEDTSEAMTYILIFLMAFDNILGGMMANLAQYINSLQMMLHLPMLHVVMPANVSEFFGLILPIAMFDIIESTYSTELIMEFDFVAEAEFAEEGILGQMRDLGYEQHNAILNLGSLAIFSFLYYVKLVLYALILKPFVYLTGGWGRSW